MEPKTVNQPTSAPTNKLTAATLTQAVLQLIYVVIEQQHILPIEYGPAVYQLIALAVTFGVAYMIPDKDNTPEPSQPLSQKVTY